MKKVSLILAALALVLGISQCKKQETPAQSGEKQHIVLTANNGNDGSKVSGAFASAVLNLTWDGNESITVSGGASGTLTYKSGVGTPNATFEGDITIDRGGDIVFTIGSAPEDEDFADQAGTADDCATLINANNHFVGTSQWQDDGNYNVTMELQYAVLKLDVSALGTSGEMTIAANGATVASVTNVSEIASAVFVAVPTDETEKAYTITCNGKTATKTWTLEKNVFYTKAGAEGAGTGNAIVIEPDAPAYTFTVDSDGTTVEFAPGNLYWDGSAFRFEENQWSFASTWNTSHVSHFYWSEDAAEAIKEEFFWEQPMSTEDEFFTEASDFQVSGYEANTWRTLSRAEWNYLLGFDPEQWAQTDDYGRPGAKGLCAWKELDEGAHNGLVILPDGTENPSEVLNNITSKDVLADYGAVFLPAAGYRDDTGVYDVGWSGYYWSGTPHGEGSAYSMSFFSGGVSVINGSRNFGSAVRLVR